MLVVEFTRVNLLRTRLNQSERKTNMAKYYFYTKIDSKKEPIYTCDANSLEDAKLVFSKGKQMSLETFNKLYEVDTKS
jgi:hypothetical protein